jgi:hypothetical protein
MLQKREQVPKGVSNEEKKSYEDENLIDLAHDGGACFYVDDQFCA